jgi:hypothetical protein
VLTPRLGAPVGETTPTSDMPSRSSGWPEVGAPIPTDPASMRSLCRYWFRPFRLRSARSCCRKRGTRAGTTRESPRHDYRDDFTYTSLATASAFARS